jgi:hypothetical protein
MGMIVDNPSRKKARRKLVDSIRKRRRKEIKGKEKNEYWEMNLRGQRKVD